MSDVNLIRTVPEVNMISKPPLSAELVELIIVTQGGGGSSENWVEISGSGNLAVGNIYKVTNNISAINLLLPSTSVIGNRVWLYNSGAGNFRVTQASGQQIKSGNQLTTSGASGYLESISTGDLVELVAFGSQVWWAILHTGNWEFA